MLRHSSTMLIALSTPAQKPLGPANRTLLIGIEIGMIGMFLTYAIS